MAGRFNFTKPPSPIGLVKQVSPGANPAERFRQAGVLARNTPIVPDSLRRDPSTGETWDLPAKWDIDRFFKDESLDYYDESGGGYLYSNYAANPVAPFSPGSGTDTSPAPISVNPTASTNPNRPRTVAAGWEERGGKDMGTMTVIFRDGTLYNYYDVTANAWRNFRNTYSKGRYIKLYLDGHRRGPAQISDLQSHEYREAVYRIARTAQYMSEGVQDASTTTKPQKASSARRQKILSQPRYTRPY